MKSVFTEVRWIAAACGLFVVSAAGAAAPSDADSHIAKGRAFLMTAPQAALQESDLARGALSQIQAGRDRAIAMAGADWLSSAALLNLNQPDKARAVADRALHGPIAKLAPRSTQYADLLVTRAVAARTMGQMEPALADSLTAFRIFQANGERRSQAIALTSIGGIYLLARDYKNALRYYQDAADVYRDDPGFLVSSYANRGVALKEMGRYPQAEAELDRGLTIARRIKSPILEARLLGDLAGSQLLDGNLEGADNSVQRGLAILQTQPTGNWTPTLLGAAAQLAEQRGDNRKAATLLERVFAGRDLDQTTFELRPFLQTGYRVFKELGETPRALEYLEAYKTVDDRARSLAASANAALMSARFDFANQQARIADLRANEVKQQATIEQNRARTRAIILGGLLAVFGIVSSLLLFGFVSIRRSRDRERDANEELSRSNDQLEKALAARTEFLATTSHEIRTPLNGILGMTQVLLADRGIDPPVRERIQLVHGAGQTMKALVDDILDVAKMANGEIQIVRAPMNLTGLLTDVVNVWRDQAAAKGIRLVLDADGAPTRIVEDEVRLRQIVFNLVSNAVKFTDRGEVRVAATASDTADARRLRIGIADTGIGLPADRLDDIFESFRQVDGGTTRRHGGSGLGLAICRNLARAMGGDVTVASIFGTGATFTLDLPLEEVVQPVAAAGSADAPARLSAVRLLLAEANPLSQSVLKAVLTPHIAALEVVGSDEAALEAVDGGRADLVLADAGAVGSDMARVAALALAANRAGARLALLWPTPDQTMEAQAAAAGVTLLIAKPVQAAELLKRLQGLYAEPGAAAEIAA